MDESAIEAFWTAHPCGDHIVGGLREEFTDSYERFFRAYDAWRYRQEGHIPACLDQVRWDGRGVLEIGTGQGAESEQIIRRGGRWSGLDLTAESITRVSARLRLRDLPYETIRQGSAVAIPWPDDSFEIVFSHGVLHHVPDIAAAQREIHRVLKPGGQLVVMLYAKRSMNYQLSIRLIRRAALLAAFPLRRTALIPRSPTLRAHLDNAAQVGLTRYLALENFTHRSTDGPLNPYARVYSMREVARDFPAFVVTRSTRHYMHAPPLPVHGWPGERLFGWHLWVHMQPRTPDDAPAATVPTAAPVDVRHHLAAVRAQNSSYRDGVDYRRGSPHLAHPAVRRRLISRITRLVEGTPAPVTGRRVLEIGGGHGSFTAELVAMGADVTVSEVSAASADVLRERFDGDPRVTVLHDRTGTEVLGLGPQFDVVLCISVLHHLPDYLGFVEALQDTVRPGGSFASYQDPDWYPRRKVLDKTADRAAYFAWRLAQGDLVAGAKTRMRRLRGRYDVDLAADMTEYHVVRQGLDEVALADRLRGYFADVQVNRYWATQARMMQGAGERLGRRNNFAIEATGRRDHPGGVRK